ncbi:MAG TPA: EVE domain-containing protein [Marinagarivorans sp.]
MHRTTCHWLFKTEPDVFSIHDLDSHQASMWDGVRNYTARNFLRDTVQCGDEVFIYHSSCKAIGIAGLARVSRQGYSDPAQFDANSPYFDAKSTRDAPRWYCVDLKLTQVFPKVIPLAVLKAQPKLANMMLIKQPRLSVSPVTDDEFAHILSLLE